MAFFGLTQLGPQSTFNASLISLQNYSSFAEEDFQAAFDQFAAEGQLALAGVDQVCEIVFGGMMPAQELEALLGVLQQFGGFSFSFDQLMTAIATVASGKAATAQGYTSYLDWRADLRKHTRIEYDPKTAFVTPILGSMEYGWNAPTADYATKRHPKVSSAETRYADSMVRQGEDYLS